MMDHVLTKTAAVLISAAVGVLAGGVADELVAGPASASTSLPTKLGNYRIVWEPQLDKTGTLACYIARPWKPGTLGVWLCS